MHHAATTPPMEGGAECIGPSLAFVPLRRTKDLAQDDKFRVRIARSSKRVLIRAPPINHRNRNFQQPEVDRQLATVVIPVVQHGRPQNCNPRLAGDRLSLHGETPTCQCCLFTHAAEKVLGCANALVVRGMDLFNRVGTRRVEIGLRDVKSVLLQKFRQIPGIVAT